MLQLLNIERNDKFISATYNPENSGVFGFAKIDLKSGKSIDSVKSEYKYEGDTGQYLVHAIWALQDLMEEKELPETQLVMWY